MDNENKIWSPYQIKLILHAYVVRSPWPMKYAPIYQNTVDELEHIGLIVNSADGIITTTPRGDALVSMWTMTPLPELIWIDPRSGKRA